MSRKIKCLVTGNQYTFGKDYFETKVVEYGDEDSLKKYFITKKAKTYLNKGYSVQEIRNILNVEEVDLPGDDSQAIKELIDFHRVRGSSKNKRISNTMNFATHKSDPRVLDFINNIRNYE
tara:strand:+ start:292 stop:651 length:360 start_codon:yes stop_codon:yes gene_type:complete